VAATNRILDLLLIAGVVLTTAPAFCTPLQGTIKQKASSNPSLTVITPGGGKSKAAGKGLDAGVSLDDKTGNIVQFSAGKTYKPGEAAPRGSKVLPYSALYNAPKAGLGGLNTGANGYQGNFRGNIPGSIYRGGGSIYNGGGSIYKGAGSIYNRSAVPVFGRQTFFSSASVSSNLSANHGITNWAPGYDVRAVVRPNNGLSAVPRAFGAPAGNNNLFGNISPQGKVVTRAFGSLYVPNAESARAQAIKTAPLVEATAQAEALPALKAEAMARPTTWEAWYSRLASAIYTRWQLAEVSPGCARALITVDKNRDVDPQITDFIPVKANERDVAQETKFREAAVHAIKSVGLYEIPLFPVGSTRQKVTFEMDLRRSIDGPLGVSIVRADSGGK